VILVDSSAWIEYFTAGRGSVATRLDDALRGDGRVCIVDIVVAEVLQGFRNDRDFELARRTLGGVERLPLSYTSHVNAARLFRRLRSRGVTPKTIDCLVAQACLEFGAELLTSDADFHDIARHSRLRLAH
jgi:predicted nucleic acid-binding protein